MTYSYYQKMARRELRFLKIRTRITDTFDKHARMWYKLREQHQRCLADYDGSIKNQELLNVICDAMAKLNKNAMNFKENIHGHDYSYGIRTGQLTMHELNDSTKATQGACPSEFKHKFYPPSKYVKSITYKPKKKTVGSDNSGSADGI